MDVFVIHSGKDRAEVEKHISVIKQSCHSFNPLVLNNGGVFWKIDAKNKIKKAQMVVFFVGEASHKSENIDWEIRTAIKLQKPIPRYVEISIDTIYQYQYTTFSVQNQSFAEYYCLYIGTIIEIMHLLFLWLQRCAF